MLSIAPGDRSSTSGPRGRSQIFCFVNGIVLRVRMIVQKQALRSRWENLRVFVSPLSSRGPRAWPLSLVSSLAQHQASLPVAGLQSCVWHSPSVSTPSRQLPEAKAQTPLAPLQMLAKVPGSFSEPHIVFQMYPWGGRALAIRAITAFCLLLTGNHGLGVAGRKAGQGCPLLVQTWGKSGGFRALGWLLAGVGTARTVRAFIPHAVLKHSSLSLSVGLALCLVLWEHKGQRPWPLPPRSLHPVGSSRTLATRKPEHQGVNQSGSFQL